MSRCPALLLPIALFACAAHAQAPVGQLFASDASVKGSVVMAAGGAQVLPGSSVTAGDLTASLRLARGGELRICPRAALSVNAAPNGRNLMFGMSTGAVEVHYPLARSSDTILTPDFRIELVGPGEFHLAVGADAHGNTCLRTLPENTASVIVTELMGNEVYQVPRDGQVLFHGGSMKNPDPLVPVDCGCPPPPRVERAEASPLPSPGTPHIGKPAAAAVPGASKVADSSLAAAPPPLAPGEVHVTVDAPFVFNAAETPAPVPAQPAIARLRIEHLPGSLAALPETARPPELVALAPDRKAPLAKSAQKKGLLGHVRSFFAAIFR